jgi:hypothetical protein
MVLVKFMLIFELIFLKLQFLDDGLFSIDGI